MIGVAKLSAPIAPFFMENLFCDLNNVTKKDGEKSVHLTTFPLIKNTWINSGLETKMNLTKNICSSILFLRKKEGIRVRQPLDSIPICLDVNCLEEDIFVDLIKSEVNVKRVLFSNNSNTIVNRRLVVNFPVLGKKYGRKMRYSSKYRIRVTYYSYFKEKNFEFSNDINKG